MTKNNLQNHLAWLLRRGPPLYPALAHISPVEFPDRLLPEPYTTEVARPVKEASESAEPICLSSDPAEASLPGTPGEDGSREPETGGMARLQFAPHSTSRPRMLSQLQHDTPSKSPKTLILGRGSAPDLNEGTAEVQEAATSQSHQACEDNIR